MSEGMGPLNLSGANLKGFEPVEAGRYLAEVFEIKMDATKGREGAKMPAGTPMIKIQFRLIQDAAGNTEDIENKRAFTQYVIPPEDYDQKKAANMKGMLANFFIATGDEEKKVLGGKFNPFDNLDDYYGRQVALTLSKEQRRDSNRELIPDEYQNVVKSVKPASALGTSVPVAGGGLL